MSDKITFKDLIDKIASDTGRSKRFIHDLLVETANLTKEGLEKDGHVNLVGFGRFRLKWHEERPGRNPRTGEAIIIPAHNSVTFKPESSFRNQINAEYSNLKSVFIEDESDSVENTETIEIEEFKQDIVAIEPNYHADISEKIIDENITKATEELVDVIKETQIEKTIEEPVITSNINETIVEEASPETIVQETKTEVTEVIEPPFETVVESQPYVPYEPDTPYISETTKKSGLPKWTWLLVPLVLIVILIIVFSSQESEKEIISSVSSETSSETLSVPTEKKVVPADTTPRVQVDKQRKNAQESLNVVQKATIYTVKAGDHLWKIAKEFYGNADLWPNIYRKNMGQMRSPDLLHIGKKISIPPLEGKLGKLSKQDMLDIAEGFIEVYLAYKKIGNQKAKYFLWVVKKWNANLIIDRYSDQIEKKDLEFLKKIHGYPRLNKTKTEFHRIELSS